MKVWVVNDYLTTIPGSRTLWHDLVEWFDAYFIGGDYSELASYALHLYRVTDPKPDIIIRNGSYFPPLDLPVPQIALFQDILSGQGREMQLAVMQSCTWSIFNSTFTQAQFPEAGERGRVIPLPIDFDLFRPLPDRDALREKWDILPNSVCWIGARSHVKGWDILVKLIAETEFNFCLVVKDEIEHKVPPPNVRLFSRLPQADLVEVINACSVGLCTSRVETQHLAGLEMGACGLPLVTTNVGAYYNRNASVWGEVFDPAEYDGSYESHLLDRIYAASQDSPSWVRNYWLAQGFDRAACEKAWREVVEDALGA